MKTKKTKETKAQLKRRIYELEAQLIHNYHFSTREIEKCSSDHFMASAVIIEITALGGRQLINPTSISDGLSAETIKALKADFKRSFEQKTEFKP